MATQAPANPSYRPPSPWLRKFGGMRPYDTNQTDVLRHSSFAPLYPPLDVTHYAEHESVFRAMQPIPQPDDHSLDVLFSTERNQLHANAGLTTWECVVLNEHLINDLPGGHQRNYPSEPEALKHPFDVEVDESKWHPIFAKDKWYDFRQPILNASLIPGGAGEFAGIRASDVWSVDTPVVWKELRVVLELANRWLRHMVKAPWLNQLLYEEREEWMEAEPGPDFTWDPELILGPNGKPWRIPGRAKDFNGKNPLEDIANRLSSKIVWTFVDDGHQSADDYDTTNLYGSTVATWNDGNQPRDDTPDEERAAPFIAVYIHVQALRVLLHPASTLAERGQATWSLAMTILHEAMHAINLAPILNQRDRPMEPYYMNEWSAELGSSGINSFFGSDFFEAPQVETAGKTGFKYGLAGIDFPFIPATVAPIAINGDHNFDGPGSEYSTYPLPAAWPSSTLLQSFYDGPAQKYGLATFQAPKLLRSRHINRGFYTRVHRAQPISDAATTLSNNSVVPGLAAAAERALSALDLRRAAYARLRPWYTAEHVRWQLTPYAHVSARTILTRFTAAVSPAYRAAVPHRAEREAHQAVSGMHHWLNQRPDVEANIPRAATWFWSVLAWLAQAVLPYRESRAGFEYPSRVVENVWFPSRACAEGGNANWRFPPTRTVYERAERTFNLPARHQQGHMSGDEAWQEEWVGNRVWLLEQALQKKQACEGVYPLPAPLSVALEGLFRDLFQQAYELETDEEGTWLEWRFEWPRYSRDLRTRQMVGYEETLVPLHALQVNPEGFEISPPPTPGGAAPVSGQPQGAGQPQGGGQPEESGQAQGCGQPEGGGPPPGSGQQQARTAQVVGKILPRRVARPRTRYFTVSEVGDKTSDDRTQTNWALSPDSAGGYDVVDISEILQRNASLDVKEVLEQTSLGRRIVSQIVLEAIQAEKYKPLGKLLTWKHSHEVLERDGQHGRDLWCVVGHFVYDLTEFDFDSEDEREALIELTTNGNPEALDGLDVQSLLRRLAPYKCGFLTQPAPSALPKQRAFTWRELGRQIFPAVGMYCAIDGDVYDLGRYLHSHPGGAEILRQYASRDATDEFQAVHSDWTKTLETHRSLKVGRIVEERPQPADIDSDEIVLHDRVFRISDETFDDEAQLNELRPYLGTNATSALEDEDVPNILSQLLASDDLVCAKLSKGSKRPIQLAELQERNYLPTKTERKQRPAAGDKNWRMWVAAPAGSGSGRHVVYDVTMMIMFGGPELEKRLRPWAGKKVDDPSLADWLHTHCASFITGKLVEGDTRVGTARKAQIHATRRFYKSQTYADSKKQIIELDNGDLGRRRKVQRSGW